MCGIIGFIDFSNRLDKSSLISMTETLHHRGPDDTGHYFKTFENITIGLGHKRLSILDLSKNGHQPISNADANVTAVYNGEIYNFKEIRTELEKLGFKFNSNSDSEVLLNAYIKWGINCLHRFVGMFSFVILDESKQEVYFCRDRSGVKPFFYSNQGGTYLFGSELKALMRAPIFQKELDLSALALYFKYSFIPAPYTVFKNCFKIEPGHFLKINLKTKQTEYTKYWDSFDFYNKPKLDISYDEAKSILKTKLIEACNLRMISDVPVGIFLSSGYDSSLVAALLQSNASQKINTFTIGFNRETDETADAQRIAEYLGTNHHQQICSEKEALAILPELATIYDEPFADSSAVPTILVSRLAKKYVKVALSADGGDEIFCGYINRYTKRLNLFKSIFYLNKLAPSLTKVGINGISKLGLISERISRLQSLTQIKTLDELYEFKLEPSIFMPNEIEDIFLQKDIDHYETNYHQFDKLNNSNDAINKFLAIDFKIGLTDDILQKVDRAAMSTSLESREPLMDHRIVEFVAQLPSNFKLHNRTTKYILKDIVHDYIPQHFMIQTKKGFGVPLDTWLNGELSEQLDYYILGNTLKKYDIFNNQAIQLQYQKFKHKPTLLSATKMWHVLMLSMWLDKWMK
ncbi:MAG: asparagine synthase (glutamine-hydrolyzing) [bacterium]